ncbi:polysaccharide pyruvyl transferase family protein [Sphingomonas sp. Leaf412]|uniref:polysaccharide pyruvyl transferase family protein n=1 Tax=Sphingomonas sp. Leaf412 TaxID=1736370 RepID=UPI000AD163E1|nr:polysaccharide pyruvyl transferase family protein [Sphingomonas sp. Leaf412]
MPIETPTTTEPVRLRIGLLFHSLTSGNLGVGALTVANMAIAEKVAREEGIDPDFTSIGMKDNDAPDLSHGRVASVVIDGRSLVSPKGLWRAFGRSDCVLDISGGDSFADIYHPRRFMFIWSTKLMVLARGKPLILSPMTIGPFEQPKYRKLAGFIMKRARATVARDDQSYDIARKLAPGATIALAADVAFELPYESRAAERGGARPRVGINASGLLYHEAETGTNRFGLSVDYVAYTRRLIEAFLARGAEVHLITHAYTRSQPQDDDSRRADLLAADYPQAIRVPDFPDPMAAKSYISGLDFLVAGRMHACIGAYSSGTPVVPVAYSRKFGGLFGMLGYDAMIPVKGMDTDQALAFTLDAFDRRPELSAQAAAGMAQVSAKLDIYRDVLRALFRELKAKARR